MVRLEALATLTRMAGRATWAMEVAMREARTREAAIATDGEEMKLLMQKGRIWSVRLMAKSWTAWLGVEDEKMRVERKRTERRSGESGGTGTRTSWRWQNSKSTVNCDPRANEQGKQKHTNPLSTFEAVDPYPSSKQGKKMTPRGRESTCTRAISGDAKHS